MMQAEPIAYFSNCSLGESLLLRLLYRPERRSLDIVIDYAAEVVSKAFELQLQGLDPLQMEIPPRDLRHFRFGDAVFHQPAAEATLSATDWQYYEQTLLASPRVLQGVEHSRDGDGYNFSFFLAGMGQHDVFYKTFYWERRLAKAMQIDVKTWHYFDATSNDAIDFFNPFPQI